MDDDLIIAERFNAIINRLAEGLSSKELSITDRIIYYVIVARCEIDQSGYKSVFIQALDEGEILFFISALKDMDEPKLADCFRRSHQLLEQHGFFAHLLNLHDETEPELCEKLGQIGQEVKANGALWLLDTKLAKLIEI